MSLPLLLSGGSGGGGSAEAPAAISTLSAEGEDESVLLSWDAPDNNGSPISDYIIQYQAI
jgi:hypothetical protein